MIKGNVKNAGIGIQDHPNELSNVIIAWQMAHYIQPQITHAHIIFIKK